MADHAEFQSGGTTRRNQRHSVGGVSEFNRTSEQTSINNLSPEGDIKAKKQEKSRKRSKSLPSDQNKAKNSFISSKERKLDLKQKVIDKSCALFSKTEKPQSKDTRRKSSEKNNLTFEHFPKEKESKKEKSLKRKPSDDDSSVNVKPEEPTDSNIESFSIYKNLRSNSSATVIQGIPYYQSFREFTRRLSQHFQSKDTESETKNKPSASSTSCVETGKEAVDSKNLPLEVPDHTSPKKRKLGNSSTKRANKKSVNKGLLNINPLKTSPELDGFRRTRRGKNTGSCASSSGRRSSSLSKPQGAGQGDPSASHSGTSGSSDSATAAKTALSRLSMSDPDSGSKGNGGARPRHSDESPATPPVVSSSGGAAAAAVFIPENEPEEGDMGRLQALLEARGLPSQLFGALGPRMTQLLHRTMGSGNLNRAQQLIQGLQSIGNEDQQLTSAIELCQMLVMGNEDTLAGFPVKQAVPALIVLLQMEHNFDIMNHACRALTYMMEALPRSSAVVVDAVPSLLEKLRAIQCMDVAEQSLTALDMLSKRHSKAILHAGGISACLMFLDFFSISAQRSALSVTANCVQSITPEDFHFVRDSLPLLSSRLTHSDKKSVESCCVCFCRLVDNFQTDQRVLKEIAVHGLLQYIQQLLVVNPPVINTGTFVMVVRMLAGMCCACPDLAVLLLKQKISDTLCYLLTGTSEVSTNIELIARTPQELFELVCLIGELMPKLPTDGIFSIDSVMTKGSSGMIDSVCWQWRDDRGNWHSYTPIDSKIIEAAHMAGEDEISLSTMGRAYTIDFNTMQQVNEDTGTSRPVIRKLQAFLSQPAQTSGSSVTSSSSLSSANLSASSSTTGSDPNIEQCDSRAEILKEDMSLATNVIQTLFSVLYEVYSSSAGPTVRHKCLQTLLRMQYYADAELLRDILKSQPVSSHIAAMMASQDLKVVVAAIQMADILMQKLPDVFSIYFRREGVMHQIKNLAQMDLQSKSPAKNSSEDIVSSSGSSASVLSSSTFASESSIATMSSSSSERSLRKNSDSSIISLSTGSNSNTGSSNDDHASSHTKLSDVLKRKKPPKRAVGRKSKGGTEDQPDETPGKASAPSRSSRKAGKESKSGSSKMSFLPSLNPRTWGKGSHSDRSSSSSKVTSLSKDVSLQKQLTVNSAGNREKVKRWIKEQATRFLEQYFREDPQSSSSHPALTIMLRLTSATGKLSNEAGCGIDCLQEISVIMKDSDVSPFEIIHSGLIQKILKYLTSNTGEISRDHRIRSFLHVFLNCPTPDTRVVSESSVVQEGAPLLLSLVSKLMGCLHQLEQFQVKVHELPGGNTSSGRGSNALRFFNTHQLKCNLQRHPNCTSLKQWKGGPVKIDPLALVQAIERYLVIRGYGRLKHEADEDISDDDNSDDDVDTMAAVFISQGTARHKLEFFIGERLLPYDMTVYQAIKNYSNPGERDSSEADTDTENPMGQASIWVQTHTIWYRPAADSENSTATTPKKTKGESKHGKSSHKKPLDDTTSDRVSRAGMIPALHNCLTDTLPAFVTVQDPSLEVITVLRTLHALNRYWTHLYEVPFAVKPMLLPTDFFSSKLTAKANRQLQDPLVIMTGNLPNWLAEIAAAAPFLLPFETRQLLFYATTFDRDRALMRLQDTSGDTSTSDTSERVTPRLDRRRKLVSREDLIKQAEKVFEDVGNSKALLEIQYENEVGTGLGPTLEFYALVSKDLQKAEFELWRGDIVNTKDNQDNHTGEAYFHSACGLFPAPLARNSKSAALTKVKNKFKLLGKVMAKALMDSRMLDIPLSLVFYKWLLGQEHSLTSSDLQYVDNVMAKSLKQLEDIVHKKARILEDKSHTRESRQLALDSLSIDGCSIEDLDLDFTLPGSPHIELKKGGKDIAVTLNNLEEYLQMVVHTSLVESVRRQFESLREGFESVVPISSLQSFFPEELEQLFCGSMTEAWDAKMLMECCRCDHGYTHDSRAVKFLLEVLSSYTPEEQRQFLQFVTGSPRLPVGGFRSLNPPLTIVRKTFEASENPDDFLPSVMTCVNYLKLPDYSTLEVMRAKLQLAALEGQLSFHLS